MNFNNTNKSFLLRKCIIPIVLLSMMACSEQSQSQNDCGITVDSVSIIDSMKVGDTTYYLVHRISGWSDKTEILELYNSEPVFDNCAKSKSDPIYGDSLEMSLIITHVFLDTKNKILDISYAEGQASKTHNSNLKLELK